MFNNSLSNKDPDIILSRD